MERVVIIEELKKIIKPYENEAEAVKEMKRLIAQKKKKGFKLV